MLGVARNWRDEWYKTKIAQALTLRGKIRILQSKLLADVQDLPEDWRDEALVLVATRTEGILDEIHEMLVVERWTA